MKKESIWMQNLKSSESHKLRENIVVDVLIIGGGITGISLAYQLRNSCLSVCLVDKDHVGSGVTSKTTGKVTYLQDTIYSDLVDYYDYNKSKLYYESQITAMKEIKEIINQENIKCNYEKVTSSIFTNDLINRKKLIKERNILKSFGINVDSFNSNSYSSITVPNTAVFNPLKYLLALKEKCLKTGINIFENTTIYKIKKEDNYYKCYSKENFIITCKTVVLACHYPFYLFPFFLPLYTYVEQSYIVSFPVKNNNKSSCISIDKNIISTRFYENRNIYELYLTGTHRMGNALNRKMHFEEIVHNLKANINYAWMNDDLITLDGIPYIGNVKKSMPNLYIATGYNTWGMTNGTLASIVLRDLILGKENRYANLVSPLRKKLKIRFMGKILINIFENGKSFIQNKIFPYKLWYNNEIYSRKINGRKVLIYNDGIKEHIVYNKCPHMGCSLIFNQNLKIWECPCHASKFDIDGNVISGPSTKDIGYKNMRKK